MGCDVVMHIGAIGDVYLTGEQPDLTASANVVGTAVVLDAAARHEVRAIYASTWEVYGEAQYEPINVMLRPRRQRRVAVTAVGFSSRDTRSDRASLVAASA